MDGLNAAWFCQNLSDQEPTAMEMNRPTAALLRKLRMKETGAISDQASTISDFPVISFG
jgi:hypothetical protein